MAIRASFDPERVAGYEYAGWAAYYARDWPQVLWLMVRLNREQFGLSWPAAVAAALDTVRAAAAFAPVDNDLAAARHYLTRYYARTRRITATRADPATLAALELDYWIVHRELANRRKIDRQDDDLTPLVDSLSVLHAALFDSTPERMRVSAALRALAAATVDGITGDYSTNVAADWQRIHRLLYQSYRAVQLLERGPPADSKGSASG